MRTILMTCVLWSMWCAACAGSAESPAYALARPELTAPAVTSCSIASDEHFPGCSVQCDGQRPMCRPGTTCPTIDRTGSAESLETAALEGPLGMCMPAEPICECSQS